MIIFMLILNHNIIFSQSYKVSHNQTVFTKKIIGKKIIGADTIFILEKKEVHHEFDQLPENFGSIDYDFLLPDSLPDGKYAAYYNKKKQNMIFIVTYKYKVKNGGFKFFHKNKTIYSIGFYENNCLNKIYIEYSNKSKVTRISNYTNCKLNGFRISFAFDGDKFYDYTNYLNGKRDGDFIRYRYDINGFPLLLYNFEYRNDTLIKRKYVEGEN